MVTRQRICETYFAFENKLMRHILGVGLGEPDLAESRCICPGAE